MPCARRVGEHLSIFACTTGCRSSTTMNAWRGWRTSPRRPAWRLAACNDVHAHDVSRRRLQDVLVCIRHGCTLADAGHRLFPNGERHLKAPHEMAALLASSPRGADAIARSATIAIEAASGFSLDELRYQYPDEVVPPGRTPMEHLRDLAREGAAQRYPQGVPAEVRVQIEHEFAIIDDLGYAPFFLTVHDLCAFARGRGILHQGRGAAANSAVCYCLGVTAVDPARIDVLFERFMSRERNEPPDIDIDFEHERREEVIQYIYGKYGRDRAALTAEVISYRRRSAVRDIGKALGLSLDLVGRLAKDIDWWSPASGADGPFDDARLRTIGVDPRDPTIRVLGELVAEILGFPRHLSQHVGGFVITQDPLCELVPVENAAMPDRTVVEWDKDDIDAMNMIKVDVLGLGMLTCISRAFALVNDAADGLALHTVPPEDPAVYDMVCAADTIGVFQIESRAQMSMLPRLRPRCFYDLVIEVAIVRPGPIQGQMVHPYLRRRDGREPVVFPDEAVRKVLGKTLGVPLFQEQAMALSIVAAGFTPGEADRLRRAIGAWKTRGNMIAEFGERIVAGMTKRGYDRGFAEQVFTQIKGFSGYGFPESHAASFALLVYVSAWLKRRHPAAFAAALINSQPMGFYAPAQIVRDAREHGVQVLPVDVLRSAWDCTLEASASGTVDGAEVRPGLHPGLRLGLRLVRGLARVDADRIVEAVRAHGSFATIRELHRASGVRATALRRLAAADAFASMGLSRQHATGEAQPLADDRLPLFEIVGSDPPPCPKRLERLSRPARTAPAPLDGPRFADKATCSDDVACSDDATCSDEVPRAGEAEPDDLPSLPPLGPLSQVSRDYGTIGLSLRAHPMSFVREALVRRGVRCNGVLRDERAWPQGRTVAVAGVVLVRQRPGTANGIVFMTIEDETGVANIIVRPDVWERHRRAAKHGTAVLVRGRVERQGIVVHVLARRIDEVRIGDASVGGITGRSRDFH
ncbi:MAG: error-prone DNA polymerase [Phycisphaerales bacterium]